MRKFNLLVLLCLFIAGQAFAQQRQSFAEYWFGVKSQGNLQKNVKATSRPNAARQSLRSVNTNADGIITLDLSTPINPETFEVNGDRVWIETYNDEDYTFFEANSPFAFSHLYGGPGMSFGGYYWDGFTYSKNGDNTNYGNGGSESWVAKQWGNMAAGGIKTDAEGNIMKDENGIVLTDVEVPYLVAYWGYAMEPEYFYKIPYYGNLTEPAHNLQTIFTDGNTYEAVGLYVNNHPWPYYGNIDGDGFARKFGEGDYFKLIIHGLDAELNETGKSVVHILAEFTDGQLIQSPNWEWVDLSALGEIGGLYYTMETTDENPIYGPNTACYFCMDKLQVKRVSESIAPAAPSDLTGIPTESTISLSWTASTDNVGVTGYNIYVNGEFNGTTSSTSYTVTGLTAATVYIFSVEAFDAAGNKSETVSITLSTLVATGISSVNDNIIHVYPNPFNSYIVLKATKDGTAVIYDLSGKPVLQAQIYAGSNRINTSALVQGVYVLKYGLNSVRIVK